ncbi:ubiquinone anaerobic biosynthesis accessory factor UbiT [Magnetospirillum sulfuroxidans]|uniref:SCP2 sterol-binding domain-containing protein n=1 Tax=Magnetospirillum sulfuroxidans TaxID=611300 RepID=A0ABS5IAE3_9PROT|nr:SCP2 sterol-binding domain-containing protein [Magnetospirillum sulfuroxidans]MBR9971396.1 SCP2 sterol-binding domain-containing protein [Magnetospirillum sulfuroxidans]
MMEGQFRPGHRPMTPPFSPVLLLGLALKPLRPALLQPLFDAMLKLVRNRHPDILERMEAYGDRIVCIDPVDLPFALLLEPNPAEPRLTVRRFVDADEVHATIRGPLETLIALAEGKVDGDALFFSRQLQVEGDTEVVVALRNAIDGAGIDLIADLASALGPLATPAQRAASSVLETLSALRGGVETMRQSLIAPAMQNAAARDARLAELEAEVKALRKASRRGHA